MKKNLHYTIVFLLFLITSCATDKLEVQESNNANAAAVWAYDGNNSVLKRVIQELRNGSSRESLERKLAKNQVLWDNARFTLIDGKKWILVPFLSEDKDNVIGVLSLVKNSKNTTIYDMTVRSRLMTKNNILPFWDKGVWLGYFMALDKNILGIKNGNPGFKSIKNPKALAQKEVCGVYEIETIHYSYSYTIDQTTGEISNYQENEPYSTFEFSYKCYNVPDDPTPTPDPTTDPNTGNDGGGGGNPLQIFNYLNGIADCIYQRLNVNSTDFKNAIKKFDGELPVSHLTFIINNNLPVGNYGITNPPDNYNITIELSNTQLANISTLGGAIAIAHEIVHAEIFRKLLSAAQKGDLNTNNYTTQENINFINSLRNNFPGLYDYYYARVHPTWNHDLMAQHYRSTIADIAQQFDSNTFPRQVYEDLAWAGLRTIETNVNSIAWNNLTNTEQQRILSNLTNVFHNGTKNCN